MNKSRESSWISLKPLHMTAVSDKDAMNSFNITWSYIFLVPFLNWMNCAAWVHTRYGFYGHLEQYKSLLMQLNIQKLCSFLV